MKRNALVLASLVLLGCSGPSKPEPQPGSGTSRPPVKAGSEGKLPPPAPEPRAPEFSERHAWPPYFKGATCSLLVPKDTGISWAEGKTFRGAFEAHVFGPGSPFKRGEAEADFRVTAQLRLSSGGGLKGRVETQLRGSSSKSGRRFRYKLRYDQPGPLSPKLRLRHAKALGRLAAKQLLGKLARARGAMVGCVYGLSFEGFQEFERQDLFRDLRDKRIRWEQRGGRAGTIYVAHTPSLGHAAFKAFVEQKANKEFVVEVEERGKVLFVLRKAE